MGLQECTLQSARLCAGLNMPCLVITEPTLEITAPSDVCQTWMDRKISDLERKRDGA